MSASGPSGPLVCFNSCIKMLKPLDFLCGLTSRFCVWLKQSDIISSDDFSLPDGASAGNDIIMQS